MSSNRYLNDLQPGTFIRLPKSRDLFLETPYHRFTYGKLAFVAESIKHQIDSFGIYYSRQSPLLIPAFSSESLILFLGACQLLKIPVFPFNPAYSEEDLAGYLTYFPNSNLVNLSDEKRSVTSSSQEKTVLEIPKQAPDRSDKELNYFKYLNSQPERIILYLHTSGTSGAAKIVPIKNRQLLYAAQANSKLLWPGKDEKWLLCLPLHHIGGLSIIGRTLLYGSGIYYEGKFDENKVGELLYRNNTIKIASLVPTMLKRVLDTKFDKPHSDLTGILLGGGPLNASLVQRAQKRNIPIVSSYGMTETCAQIAAHKITDKENVPDDGSLTGYLFQPNEIQIRDENNRPSGNLKSGSVHIRGPQVFDGYHNKEQNSDDVIFDREGFFNTGDFGFLDTYGRLIIQSRRTDLIVTGGENVSPYVVESALEELEEVKEAVVFGVDDPEWGKKVAAAIIQKDATSELDVSTVKERLSGSLRPHQIPKTIYQRVEEFPRTRTGKFRRREISEYYNSLQKNSE